MKSIQTADFRPPGNKSIVVAALMLGAWLGATAACVAQTANSQLPSKWDQDLLNIELRDVVIKTNKMLEAWQEMGAKYMLRANLYMDAAARDDATTFAFKKERATEKELLEAFLAAYPSFTYTQDPETMVLWLHPKRITYGDILKQRVVTERPAMQVHMYDEVLTQLNDLLAPSVRVIPRNWGGLPAGLDYNVDLPAGVLSVRQIVNFCCGADPTTVFEMGPDSWGVADIEFWPITLGYGNPFAMPRAAAVRFWELEIGKPANGTPTMDEVVAAMSDRNPGKRRAAQLYQKAASVNYPPNELTKKITDSEKKLWVWLAVMIPPLTFAKDSEFFVSSFSNNFVPLSNDLKQVQDPRLALLWSLELARAKQDTSYLDAIVSGHKFSEADIAGIKPDVYKVARVSKSVREKCIQLKLDVPEFSPENLRELERTNLFHLIPEEKVQ